jgi:hypothetical protein
MEHVNVKRRTWLAGGLAVTMLGCGATPKQEPGGPTATEEAFSELAGVNCSVVRPKTEPDLMAWDAASRMNLSRLRKQGVVAVRYRADGCNVKLVLLPNCIGKGKYEYEPYASNDSKLLRNKQELFSELPLGAVHLAGKLASQNALRTDTMLVGMAALPPTQVVMASDLQGPGCAQATHVISRVYLGGFGMASGDERALSAQATVFGAGAGASRGGTAIRVTREGNLERCQEAQRTGREEPLCSVPLRVGLIRIEGGGQSACPEGSNWDGQRCVVAGGGGPRTQAYPDASQCLRGRNALYVEGNPEGFNYSGRELIRDARIRALADRDKVQLSVQRNDAKPYGNTWQLRFSTERLDAPLEVREYLGTDRLAQGSEGSPGLSVSGYHRTCGRSRGRFRVIAIEWSGKHLERFAAVFQQQCGGGRKALRGCVYYDADD